MPHLENPKGAVLSGPILSDYQGHLIAVALVVMSCLCMASGGSADVTPGFYPAAGLLILTLLLHSKPHLERCMALILLSSFLAIGLLDKQSIGWTSIAFGKANIILACLLGALAFHANARTVGLISLGVGQILTLFLWLSLTFGVQFFGEPATWNAALVCLAVVIGSFLRFSDTGWFAVLLAKGRINTRFRFQCLAAFLGPWVFGLILYQGVGVHDRPVAVETLMIGCVIVGLFWAIYKFGQVALKEEANRAKDIQVLKTAAETDVLTELPNRAGVSACLESAWTDFQTNGRSSAIIIFDLDHFKRINDTFGHDAGDLVLRSIGPAVTPFMRAGDTIGRWGGEEFVCVLRGGKSYQLEFVAERLRAAIEGLSTPVSTSLGATCLISASFGVAQLSNDDRTVFDAVNRADKALYESKSSGRNCVSIGSGVNFRPLMKSVSRA